MSEPKTKAQCSVDGCTKALHTAGKCWGHYTSDARDRVTEDAEWIAGTDHPEHIARRVGYTDAKQLYNALRRWGRQDLVDRCMQWWATRATSKELAA